MIWIVVLSMFIAFFTPVASYDPDRDLTTLQIIQRHGYSAEAHTVLTEDGYILTLHRITGSPNRRRSPINSSDTFCSNVLPVSEVDCPLLADKTKSEDPEILSHPNTVWQVKSQPIFLQHGLVGSSADWIFGGPGNALAYLLADEGYDVWLGNARGNTYSRTHTTLSTADSKFWDFSWHEMGFYDLPASIDYALNETGYSSVIYIGFSMGTTMFYVMGTTRPEYNDKVLTMFSFAPVAFVGHLKGPLRLLASFSDQIAFFLRLISADVSLSRNQVFQRIAKNVCLLGDIPKIICRNSIYYISGGDAGQFNMTLLSIILGHVPAGTSLKTLLHYAQEIHSDRVRRRPGFLFPRGKSNPCVMKEEPYFHYAISKFQQFDRGSKKRNSVAYNQSIPPEYDLSLLHVPIELHHASDDSLSFTTDVDELYYKLKNKTGKYLVNIPGFGHFDFLWGKSAKAYVYGPVISRIKLITPVLREKVVLKRVTEGVEDTFNDAKIKLMATSGAEKSVGKSKKEIPFQEKVKTMSKQLEIPAQEKVKTVGNQLEKADKESSIPEKIKVLWNKFYDRVMAYPVKENIDKIKTKVEEKNIEQEAKKGTSEEKKDK